MTTRARILLVEDDDSISRMLGLYLGREYDVEIAKDGEAGLAILLRPPPPDLLITDVMMPKLDGFAMVKMMRASLTEKRPPVIFLTARDKPRDVVTGIAAGARNYLMKPVKFNEVDEKVKKALAAAR